MNTLSPLVRQLENGYSIIPIGKEKKPAVKWLRFQKERADLAQLEQWQEKFKDFGIVTGAISGITVVDIDVKHADKTSLETFPETYTVQTPSGGWHLYYQYSDSVQTGSGQYPQFPHVDIRNDGGYVVAPPSYQGSYRVVRDVPLAPFPAHLFGAKKRLKLHQAVSLESGARNTAITSIIGTLLYSLSENRWTSEAWPAIVKINETYRPPLPLAELKTAFQSIAAKERTRRDEENNSLVSPIQPSSSDTIRLRLRKNRSNMPFKDLSNAVFALKHHEQYAGTIRYDEFTKMVLLNGHPITDKDTLTIQQFLQSEIELSTIARTTTEDAITFIAKENSFNSALEYLQKLKWDGVPRVDTWLTRVYGVPEDEYHIAVGSNWLRAMAGRIATPGSKYDHVLVVEGEQGTRKTTSFAVLGGPWHTETSVQAESKDFLMQFNGKAIVEFSEGDTLTRSETKTLKSIITRTHDKYRAPYARNDEEHPRGCVFCMTTNDSEYLKDETGNRRWLPIQMPKGFEANIEWLAANRDQLLAEAYARRDEPTWIYPKDVAEAMQEERRIVDSLEDSVVRWYSNLSEAMRNDGINITMMHAELYKEYDRIPPVIDKPLEWRLKSILKGALKLESIQKRVGGVKARFWVPTDKTPPRNEDF